MNWLFEILKGIMIGIANIIPGVSGGTMMVSMGIYDTLIYSITHLFKQFKKSVITLLPYIIGMVLGIAGLSFVITFLLETYPLATNMGFIGLILGGLPVLVKTVNVKKAGVGGAFLFLLFFAFIILLEVFGHGETTGTAITINMGQIVTLFFVGCIASATMVIPGVSGSMILMLLGYYQPIISAVKNLVTGLLSFDMASIGTNLAILLPFGIGIVIGIFAIAKLIEILLARFPELTYCAILGLVVASPVAIFMATDLTGVTVLTVIVSILTFAVGFFIAYKLSEKKEK